MEILDLMQNSLLVLAVGTMGYLTYKLVTRSNGEVNNNINAQIQNTEGAAKETISSRYNTSIEESISNIKDGTSINTEAIREELDSICKIINNTNIKDDVLTHVSSIRECLLDIKVNTTLNIANLIDKTANILPTNKVILDEVPLIPIAPELSIVALSLIAYGIVEYLKSK